MTYNTQSQKDIWYIVKLIEAIAATQLFTLEISVHSLRARSIKVVIHIKE